MICKLSNITYDTIISVENLLLAWREFLRGKRKKSDVQEFQYHLMEHILVLHNDLKNKTYVHGGYHAFTVSDPKLRNIHKATVRDRLLHHAIHRKLYPYFDQKFVTDSYSCREEKGTHKALQRFTVFARRASRNHTRTVWVLKCDIRKFFASIDHVQLRAVVAKHIIDPDIRWLIGRVVNSFTSTGQGKGLPLGNLTSQLLVNVYMNEFDQYIKHTLKAPYYIRYADDFVFFHRHREVLVALLPRVQTFLNTRLKLSLHPNKVFLKTLAPGVDFLGWVHFPYHRVLRTTTKRRMCRKLSDSPQKPAVVQSYLGLLSHGNARALRCMVLAIQQPSYPVATPQQG